MFGVSPKSTQNSHQIHLKHKTTSILPNPSSSKENTYREVYRNIMHSPPLCDKSLGRDRECLNMKLENIAQALRVNGSQSTT